MENAYFFVISQHVRQRKMAISTISIQDIVYTKGFITSSSSATSTALTNYIHLRKGIWLVIFKTPPSNSSSTCILNLEGNGGSGEFLVGEGFVTFQNYGCYTTIFKVNSDLNLRLIAGASASYSWLSNFLDRGGLAAIRVGD